MKAVIEFERILDYQSKEGKESYADITYEGGIAPINHVISKSSVEIILGDVYRGKDGLDGKDGENGLSAYEVALKNGFSGSEEEWLESLKAQTDTELNEQSNNAISNKAVTTAINKIKESNQFMTEAEYDSLAEKKEDVLYFLYEE